MKIHTGHMRRILKPLLLASLAGACYIIGDILVAAGSFKRIHPHFNGSTAKLPVPVAGPEDIDIDTVSGTAFISVDDRRANLASPGSRRGAILIMDMNSDTPVLRNVTPPEPADFHPHGISVWRSAAGRVYLLAVSHRQQPRGHAVERFEWRDDSLVHIGTVMDAAVMTSPNDVAAVDGERFYVTNDHGYAEEGLQRTLEDYLQRSISTVNYFDGKRMRKVAEGLAFANGIALASDGSSVHVAATTGRKLFTYERDTTNGALRKRAETSLGTGVDNIDIDSKGDLWIGCHPQLLKFVAYSKDAAKASPSQVLRLRPIKDGGFAVEEVMLNDGVEYSGSSVAVAFRDRILVGSVFDPFLLIGRREEKPSRQ